MLKKYENIEPKFDKTEIVLKGDPDSNFLQWQLLQEAMVAEEIVASFERMKTKTLDVFDKIMTSKYIENLYTEFKEKSVSLKRIEVEDIRLQKSLIIPIAPIRKKIPTEFKSWFEKGMKEDEKKLEELIAAIEEENENIVGVLDQNQIKAGTAGGQQAFYELGIATVFVMANKRMIEWGKNYNKILCDKVSQTMTGDIKFTILEGLQNREGVPELKARILKIFDKPIPVKVPALIHEGKVVRKAYTYALSPEQWAIMVSRTETIRWTATGKLEGYKQTGLVKKVQFVATGDHRTCEDCLLMDGEIFTLEEAQGVIPLHCLGRCTWASVIEEKLKGYGLTILTGLATRTIAKLYSNLNKEVINE